MAHIFVKMDSVNGESDDTDHKQWIEAHNVSFSVHSPSSVGSGSGSGVGKAEPSPIGFHVDTGAHTPDLTGRQFEGTHFQDVTIEFIKQAGQATGKPYKVIKLKEVFITDYIPHDQENTQPTEQYQCTYNDIEIEYFKQNTDGNMVSAGKTRYNTKENKVYA